MPLVSVLLAVHDDARYVRLAVESVLRQTFHDLELIVVDDASTDATPDILAAFADERLVLLTNEAQLGLAASLNLGLDVARGRYVARIDADDVALPDRIVRQVAAMREGLAVLGGAVIDVDQDDKLGTVHRMPLGALAVRWQVLFGAPFFHPTVLVEREVLDRHGLRYDTEYGESEDYDLWSRLLVHAEGENLRDPLVLKRTHPGQASERRRDLQLSLQRRVALREIERVAPGLRDAELAWELGAGRELRPESRDRARQAYLALLERFEQTHGVDSRVRESAAKRLARNGHGPRALRLVPALPARLAAERARRRVERRDAHERARAWLEQLRDASAPQRVTVISPEPTPYRSPLFDLVAARPEVELTVIYASETVARRTWSVQPQHRAVILRGAGLPGMHRIVRHDYPVTPGVVRAIRASRPDVLVVSGWSTFAAQAAIAWCRRRRVPYLVLVESHDLDARPGWRRIVKGAVVPRILRTAAGTLVVGSLAHDSVVARGADPARIRVFANTVDIEAWEARAERLRRRRGELRAGLAADDDDLVVVSVGRLAPEKGFDVLVRAVAETDDDRFVLVIAGEGPERNRLVDLAHELGVRLDLTGDLATERLAEVYVAGDVFALLSRQESWGVVVNEAAACGLPLVLSDRIGAAHDLLRDGENGAAVGIGDAKGAAAALHRLAGDPGLRRRAGRRSRDLVRDWGYEPSVESFVAAVRDATSR